MTNLVETAKSQIKQAVVSAVGQATAAGELPEVHIGEMVIEVPRDKQHGDFATNVAMQITRQAKKAPRMIADILVNNMEFKDTLIEKVEVAGPGFINFYFKKDWLYQVISAIDKEGTGYGKINIGNGQKVMVEFVSANPTGPMHMGNARGGALGDCLASVLDWAGYDVTREFYINDAGNQIEKFGKSLEARYIQLLKGEDAFVFPEDGYHGEDIKDHMKDFIALEGDKYLGIDSEERKTAFVEFALKKNIDNLKADLKLYGIEYDVWFHESELYENNEVQETVDYLVENGYAYEKEDAVWFKASEFGAEKDEVLVRNNGIPTYFAADIAYHRNKFVKRGFDRVIDIWGADHHGHVARMKGAMKAVGCDPDKLDIIIMQLVRLLRNGEVARMSKRTGRSITLRDLLEETSIDAARFFFNMRQAGSHLDFDIDLSVEQSNDNPVFYVQYAHARICSIIKLLEEDGVNIKPADQVDVSLLVAPEELELLKKLAELPEEIKSAALTMEPSRMTRYVMDLAGLFHSFYNACRVKVEDQALMMARLKLVDSVRIVVKNVLDMLGINAPEKM
ncbi:arginine--tRNA ligase [Petroclostridium sp. X23]|uniref:arginine--tRNA ligase n=1 Tax=Petroclostridium sp. X23 TaxID=3045146 RepID=UPI0024AC8CD8|nr:arginine--tRNA ligase [Petroclostridium sp. X23]WHH57370.1 arginine--tRNA ligase [Petroclostridium sp. X23]